MHHILFRLTHSPHLLDGFKVAISKGRVGREGRVREGMEGEGELGTEREGE